MTKLEYWAMARGISFSSCRKLESTFSTRSSTAFAATCSATAKGPGLATSHHLLMPMPPFPPCVILEY
eukprot:53527-Eustigmatos_ZCMA.PRE.1